MKSLLIVACVVAVAQANPGLVSPYHAGLISPYHHAGAAVIAAAPAVTSSQYHAQDELGQFSYGYSGGPSSKTETRTADGITRGGYSYIDAHGLVQTVNYVSDPVHGFRVAATNLPVAPAAAPAAVVAAPVAIAAAPLPVGDTVEVAAAKAVHFAAHAEAHARLARSKRGLVYAAPALLAPRSSFGYSVNTVHHAAPLVHAAPYLHAAPLVHSAAYFR